MAKTIEGAVVEVWAAAHREASGYQWDTTSVKTALQAISELLDQLIGEYEVALSPHGMKFYEGKEEYAKLVRNDFRASQRARKQELMGGDND